MRSDKVEARDAGPNGASPAAGPIRLPARSWRGALKRTGARFLAAHLLQWAAALTFFSVLSLFPALLAVVSVLGLLGTSGVAPLVENVSQLAPGTARDITLQALRSIENGRDGAGLTLLVALAAAMWSASAYVGAFIPAANLVWGVDEARPLWKKLVVRLVLTTVLLVLTALIAVGVVLTGPIAREVGNVVGIGDAAVAAWEVAKWPALVVAVMILLAILYWSSPNVRHPGWRWLTPGSVLAVAVWIAASLGFTFYVANVSSYNATYGSIGGVLVFLIWLWLTNIAILLGATLNAELERARAIDAGMRPADKLPFLPLRDPPEEPA